MNKKLKIMFTGGGGAGNEAIWRILNSKYDLYFADCNVQNIDPIIPISKRVQIPSANENIFIKTLVDFATELSLDFLVSGVDEELPILAKNRKLFSCIIFSPDYSYISLMLDKYSCINAISKYNLNTPKTYMLPDIKKLDFPMIIKPRSGRGSRGVNIINSMEEFSSYRIFHKQSYSELIVQELLIGQEYTVLVSANSNQELNCIAPVRVDQKNGITIKATLEPNKLINRYVIDYHKNFPTSCIYNFQCIITESGDVYPFEINPRVSTTFCVSLAAGFDPFKIFNEKAKKIWAPHKILKMSRNWKNNFF